MNWRIEKSAIPREFKMRKRCLFILPYFGRFPGYFPLFLRSCGRNTEYDWILLTDNLTGYNLPDNVRIVFMTFAQLRERIERKLGFPVSLEYPYKLCDFRPAYGYLFEEDCRGYPYWGYCDCDLVFGNLNRLLSPLLEEGYDKLFASGHLTIYRNIPENTLRFFHECEGTYYYKKAFTSREGCWFDEDYLDENIHTIFRKEGAKLYTKDLSLNVAVDYSQFLFAPYVDEISKFQVKPFKRALYVWNDGEVEKTERVGPDRLRTKSYLYMHFQMRYMRYIEEHCKGSVIRIYPNAFRTLKEYPVTLKQWERLTKSRPNLHYFRRKWSNFKKKVKE